MKISGLVSDFLNISKITLGVTIVHGGVSETLFSLILSNFILVLSIEDLIRWPKGFICLGFFHKILNILDVI